METIQWIRTLKLGVVVLLIVPVLAGCWDRLEIEDRAIVLGISVDAVDPGAAKEEEQVSHLRDKFPAPEKGMIRVAAQIALPGKIPLGPGESGTGGRGRKRRFGSLMWWVILLMMPS